MNRKPEFYGIEYDPESTQLSSYQFQELVQEAFKILSPKPSPSPLIRVGGRGDGAYLLPNDLEGVRACLSPGVNNFKAFEDELAQGYGIRSHMCDFSSDENSLSTPLIAGMQTFRKAWLDVASGNDSICLADWVTEVGGAEGDDLLLQIDIEGAEYRNILACPRHVLSRFRMIAIEVHSLEALLAPAILEQVLTKFLRKISQDFICVHAHPNNCCGEFMLPESGANMPKLLELTFLRRDRFPQNKQVMYAPLLPHPLDIDRNVEAVAPIILNETWTAGVRSNLSKIKVLQEELSYQKFLGERLVEERRELQLVLGLISGADQAYDARAFAGVSHAPSATDMVDVARGCAYALSSSFVPGGEAGKVPSQVDGFFFHTEIEDNPWIKIDLGGRRLVRAVEIVNRTDMCFDRARSLYVIVHRDDEYRTLAAYCIETPATFKSGSTLSVQTEIIPTWARCVSIRSMAYTALHLSAIRVYASAD